MVNRQNHYANQEAHKQKRLEAGLVSERFPKVSSIVVHMTHFHRSSDQILMVRDINFAPASYAYFHMGCFTKKCEDGGFELSKVINGMIKKRKTSAKGEMTCKGKSEASGLDNARISYKISIKYNKKSK
ncbi:MAG TPA: hypothetical protein ENG95_00530 [Nitrospirae bacterium]|nr:hypothetical protein BMS3Abin10_00132 [bacterium BMS3Abin10]GBE39317.1 hypothetical protein BMS3Bbin08_01939 [bacterium BMS3Bbin08]HDH51753.1 hypothetical protein [Nitrospirota bacterium]HDK16744.1 hypothetical protein [Nitrospirota bacterium]HDK81905.1 hypothetical protein [Nitrospirota bacterium]